MKRLYMALAGLTVAAVPGGGFTVPATGPATGLSPRPTMQRGPGCLGAGVRRARSPACPARSRAALRAASGGSVADDAGVVLNERAEMAIDVLSFDLDGTLWPTQEVVWAANDAMQSFLVRAPTPVSPAPAPASVFALSRSVSHSLCPEVRSDCAERAISGHSVREGRAGDDEGHPPGL